MAKTPRSYQVECLEALENARKRGKKKALVVMASGLGKTLTAVFDVKEFLKDNLNARVLVLCHSADILGQIKEVFKGEFGDEYSYGMYNSFEKAAHRTDFLFANLQSISSHRKDFSPGEFDYVIVDEAHHSQAATYREAITYFQPEFLLGLTATPERMDGLDIKGVFGDTAYSYSLYEAVLDGRLAKINHVVELDDLEARLDELKKISESGEALSIARLNREFFVPKRDEEIAEVIKTKISDRPNATMVVFCQTIEHAERFAKLIDAVVVHSLLSTDERTTRLNSFLHGETRTICVVDLLNEGIDVPATDVVVFLRTTQSSRIILQQLGRGLRRVEGKDEVLVLDFVGNVERIKQIRQMQQEFESCIMERNNTPIVKEPYRLNINTSKFEERRIDILQILENAGRNYYSDEELIKMLKAKAKRDERTPTTESVDADKSMPRANTYRNRFDSFNKALELAGLRPNIGYTNEELLKMLKDMAERDGRTPTMKDVNADKNMPSIIPYVDRFGSFNKALELAGLQPNSGRYTDEELLKMLKDMAERDGRVPTTKNIHANDNMPSVTTYVNRFGSFNKALELAGLPVNRKRTSKKSPG